MGVKYVSGGNPFLDLLMELIRHDVDVSDKDFIDELQEVFLFVLKNFLNDPNDIRYFEFKVVVDGVRIRIVGMNLISSLWLSGIFPVDVESVISTNQFVQDGMLYTYNEKTKELIRKKIIS